MLLTFSKKVSSHLSVSGHQSQRAQEEARRLYGRNRVFFRALTLKAIDRFLDVSEKEVRAIEFATFAELEFNLFLPKSEFIPHLERILKEMGRDCVWPWLTRLGNSDIESYVENRTFFLHYPEQPVLVD